jgi:hypothetical protein
MTSRVLASGLIVALGGMVFTMVPAAASTNTTTTTTSPAPVVVAANGWIDYNNTPATTMALTGKQTFSESGSFNAADNCEISFTQPSIPAGDSAVVDETSYNPTLCEATYAMGLTTPSEATSLGATPIADANPATISPIPLNEYNNKVYYKTEYIDPVDITITSLATNLSYNYSSAGVMGSVGVTGDGYHFAYDGWSGAAATFTSGDNGGTTAYATGYYQQTNTDFATFMDSISGGLPVCGLTTTAVFTENQTVGDSASKNGAAPPAPSGGNSDSATGACSSLVHFGAEIGQGTTS